MLVVLFQVTFSNQKTLFPGILCFLYLLYNLRGCFFQCVVSNFYHEDQMLIFHVLRERGIWYLVLYDLGIFQVRLGMRNLEKLENLLVFCLSLYFV